MSSSAKESPKPQTFSGVPDAFYDADFSINISKKMRVPDSIRLTGDTHNAENILNDPAIISIQNEADPKLLMHVPERICVAGGESHLSSREQLPELKLENTLLGKPQNQDELVQLATPPRTLRIADTNPSFDSGAIQKLDIALKSIDTSRNKLNESRLTESFLDLDDSDINPQNYNHLRRRLLILGQRVDSLEIENNRRNKRDLLFYTFGFLYVLFRGFTWLTTRNRLNYL